MSENLYEAHRQWAIRPPDERFPSLEALRAYVTSRKESSSVRTQPLKYVDLVATPEGAIAVNGAEASAYLSNWAFSQLCSQLGAPAKYLRTLPPEMVRDCLKYGLNEANGKCKLLFRSESGSNGGGDRRWTSAFPGPKYGRIWDADVVVNLMEAVDGTAWYVPPAANLQESENAGLYASDHDVFVFLVNDENPIEVGNARLGRGFFCWNSETGAATFGLTTFLYNYVCRNHIVWGAEEVRELRIVHRNRAFSHFQTEALPTLNRFVESQQQGDRVKDAVSGAMKIKVGDSLDDTLKWFDNKPFTKREIKEAWEFGGAEGENVTTLWGMVQGMTAAARFIPHIDVRVNLERRAGALLI